MPKDPAETLLLHLSEESGSDDPREYQATKGGERLLFIFASLRP
jgi:hypothetical protein